MLEHDEKWRFCDKCGCKRIIKEKEPICPRCNGLDIIAQDKAVNIYEQIISRFNLQFEIMIEALDKTELIFWLLIERTIMVSRFMHEYPFLNLNRLYVLNDLLKKAFEVYNVKGSEKADYEKVLQLIDLYTNFIELIAIKKRLIEEGYAYCVLKKPIDMQSIKQSELFPNDLIPSSNYLDVDWINLNNSLELNMILSNEATEKYLKEHKEEYDEINNSTRKENKYTTEQTIQKLYPTIKSLLYSLTMNSLFSELYDFRYLKEKKIPVEVFSIIAECPTNQRDGLMYTSKRDFVKYIKENVKFLCHEEIYKSLVFSDINQNIFPFIIEINEKIIISPDFLNLMKLYYIPVYEKKLFNEETQKRSIHFEEEEVPNKLRQNGFKVKNDKKDRKKNKLQIDSIARKGNKVYVIETKLWDMGILFMRKETHIYRERDIKGIVDGVKYSNGKDDIIKTKKPSLLMKIEYVKENLKNLCPDHEKITSVEGLIITRSYPPIKEYKGVKVISLEEISNL